MPLGNVLELRQALRGMVSIDQEGDVVVENAPALRSDLIDRLVRTAVLGADAPVRDEARGWIRRIAHTMGIVPASIHSLYMAMGRGAAGGFTTPAINIRGLTYDVSRAIVRAAQKLDVGAVVFEIARSEIGYTEQRPAEYAAAVLGACIKEGWEGPVFIQGDHFQFNAKKHAVEPEKELQSIRELVVEALAAGFYNIDIDSSTLVDLSFDSLEAQQRVNFERCAEMTAWVRKHEPLGVTVSVGGEIGEVGKKNSTPEEFRAFMNGFMASIEQRGLTDGISKISVQTGTSHGGMPLPDGRVADVNIDFDALEAISRTARSEFGLAGAVQHGASTLPEELFDHFPRRGACEIHLATGFQNQILEHRLFPAELKARMHEYLRKTCADERKPGDTEEQFLYKTRKKAWGAFKRELWDLPSSIKQGLAADLQARFELLMSKLGVVGTRDVVDRFVLPVVESETLSPNLI